MRVINYCKHAFKSCSSIQKLYPREGANGLWGRRKDLTKWNYWRIFQHKIAFENNLLTNHLKHNYFSSFESFSCCVGKFLINFFAWCLHWKLLKSDDSIWNLIKSSTSKVLMKSWLQTWLRLWANTKNFWNSLRQECTMFFVQSSKRASKAKQFY